MIVVDTNLIAYLLLDGERTPAARSVFQRDSKWAAPLLWRSEFRSVLGMYIRQGTLAPERALELMDAAETLMQGEEYQVESSRVLKLHSSSKCSAYDCEHVALAQHLEVPLVTSDSQILGEFPDTAIAIEAYGSAD
ncbi:MAG: type II toxin-antitoxin system VapC family toxin [Candidatus Hydrogenedentes bacterium]|nr:type II toxin-antitoxin system VapC family toxin [Candidatus Hydrogenedentota bacterium]